MANVKISQLPATSAADAVQEYEINDSGTSRKVTGAQIKEFVNSDRVAQTLDVGSALIPAGTEAQRDAVPAAGYFRFNSDVAKFEGYNGTSWGSVGGGATGGGADAVFIENDQTINTDYTVVSTKNAMTTGPIEVASGVTVTIETGARWVVI